MNSALSPRILLQRPSVQALMCSRAAALCTPPQLWSTRQYTSFAPPLPHLDSSAALRNIMRKIPHPVVIVTSALTPSPRTWRGITLSSFNCFSLSPHPLVSFNIKTPSSAASTMTRAGCFAVHILRPSPRSAFLASKFAQLGATGANKVSPFEFIRSQIALGAGAGAPLLGREDDVLFRLRCETYRTVQIEDHQLWVGRVTGVDVVGEEKDVSGTGAEEEVFSLMYSDRHFRHVGETLVPHEGASVEEIVEENMDDGSLLVEERGSGR